MVDDDLSMITLLNHILHNPKGRFPADMSEPEWLANASHRAKIVTKPIYLLTSLSKNKSAYTKVDAS